jgi:copper chaperone CopZ
MKEKIKKWVLPVLLLGIITVGFVWPNASQTAQASSPAYASTSVPPPAPGQKKVILKNLGMSCVFCKAAVSAKLKNLPGVIAYDVDLKSDSATVLYDPVKVSIEGLKKAIAEAGYQVRGVEEVDR